MSEQTDDTNAAIDWYCANGEVIHIEDEWLIQIINAAIRAQEQPSDRLDTFVKELEHSLLRRYHECQDFAATPSSILLAVTNAVADARMAINDFEPDSTDEGER